MPKVICPKCGKSAPAVLVRDALTQAVILEPSCACAYTPDVIIDASTTEPPPALIEDSVTPEPDKSEEMFARGFWRKR